MMFLDLLLFVDKQSKHTPKQQTNIGTFDFVFLGGFFTISFVHARFSTFHYHN